MSRPGLFDRKPAIEYSGGHALMKQVLTLGISVVITFLLAVACDSGEIPRCTPEAPCTCLPPGPCPCTGPEACGVKCGGDGEGGCTFTCAAGTTCAFECPGGGCTFRCEANSTCLTSCKGGGCTMECMGSRECAMDCPANGCRQTCEGSTQACRITGCVRDCTLSCGGAPTCTTSCQPLEGNCKTLR